MSEFLDIATRLWISLLITVIIVVCCMGAGIAIVALYHEIGLFALIAVPAFFVVWYTIYKRIIN